MTRAIGILLTIAVLTAGAIYAFFGSTYDKLEEAAFDETITVDNFRGIEQSEHVPPMEIPPSKTPTSTTQTDTIEIPQATINEDTMPQVHISTNKGDIIVELFQDDAPNTVANFLKLTTEGFYNGVIFHRVISGFMIQGGDPDGTGRGGPGYKFADELNPNTDSYKRGYVRGTLAMANAGPNTNGSQFFIMHKDTPLPHAYTIFGRVIEGLDVVDAIAASVTDPYDRPLEEVVMNSVSVVE